MKASSSTPCSCGSNQTILGLKCGKLLTGGDKDGWLKSDYFRIEIFLTALFTSPTVKGSNQTILGLKFVLVKTTRKGITRLKSDYFRIEIRRRRTILSLLKEAQIRLF